MTLHERIQVFYSKDLFRFKPFHKKRMGARLIIIWESNSGRSLLPLVESVEESGTFKVVDYPESFIPMIDQLIRNFKTELLEERMEKKTKAKPKPQPIGAPEPVIQDGKPRRKRIQKPVYSSRHQ